MPDAGPVSTGPRFARAVEWASKLHRGQTRKGSGAPAIAHPLGVAALVLEHGGTETEAIAALLHDAIEDAGVTPKRVRKRFGAKVTRIVVACTDIDAKGKHAADRSATTWWKRKRHTLRVLADPATPDSVLRVKAADTLWNARSIVADLRRSGPEAWGWFHAGAADQLWFHRSVASTLSRRLPGTLTEELRVAVSDMERLAGWWFDVGDPQDAKGAPTRPGGTAAG